MFSSAFNLFGGAIFNDFQSSETDFYHLVLQEPACGKFFPMVMSSIIWSYSQILKAIDPYGECKKIKLKRTKKCKKNPFPGKYFEKKNDQLFFVELLIAVGHAPIKI